MPVNNALTPEGSNALGAAFGYYPQLKKYRQFNDPVASSEMPLQFMRSRFASTMGAIPDLMNLKRSLLPNEAVQALESYGQIAPEVPYGSQYFQENLPLPPQGPAQQMAANVGSVVPLSPAEILQTARLARKAAMAGGATAKQAGRLVGEELNAAMLGERPNTLLGAITPKPMFAVEPNANQLAQSVMKPKAEVSPLGFYSAVEQQALNIPRKQGTGVSFLNDLSKGQDVKKYEMEAMGLEDFLKNKPNVTRQEVQDFIANNRINVQEKILGGNEAPSQDLLSWMSSRNIMQPRNPEGWQELSQKLERYAQQHQKAQGAPESSQRYFTLSEEAGRISEGLDAGGSTAGATKYQKYQLPGGDNYRELLLTLPNQWEKPRAAQIANEAKIKALRQEMYGTSGTDEIRSEISRLHNENTVLQKQISDAPIYKSSHFDEPNILAHMRVNDRVDAEGKKMLLIEEVQSDWHQAGREKGYKGKGTLTELPDNYFVQELKTIDGDTMYVVRDNSNPSVIINKDYNKQSAINGVINELNATSAGGVPDAPFKDTWHQLALKRAIKEAVDKGYDRIGLTTGAQQAERYDLSKQISKVRYFDEPNSEKGVFHAYDLEGNNVLSERITKDKIQDYIGKDASKKLLDQSVKENERTGLPSQERTLSGLDLSVGGEGMKKYYDEVYPNYLNKLGKKYGAQVGETRIKTGRGVPGGEPVRYLDITPEMRKAVKEGQPLASIEEELAKALA